MAQVNVTINGKVYRMACEDGQEGHLQGLAARLDQMIDQLRGSFGEIGDQRLRGIARELGRGAGAPGSTLVEGHDPEGGRVEGLALGRLGAAARPAMQEDDGNAVGIAAQVDMKLMTVADRQAQRLIGFNRLVEGALIV